MGKGTGLGLSLVYEIAQKNSGAVEVQSRPGRTEFVVKFPARTGREFEKHVEEVNKIMQTQARETRDNMLDYGRGA